MNIAFIYNVRHHKASLKNKQAMQEAEFDEPSTINGIRKALQELGHQVFKIEANENAYLKLKRLHKKIDFAFNIAEGLHGCDREGQIPAMLEMLQIPYNGSKPLTQAICLNKAKTKEILKFHKIPTPNFQLFKSHKEKISKNLNYPLIVKPNYEGSSKGIFQNSVVNNKKDLLQIVKNTILEFKQPVIAEELIPGREFTVGFLGNNPVEILPPVEIDYSHLPKNFIPIDSYETKWIVDSPKSNYKTVICPAKISKILLRKIEELCLKTKEALEINDYCRLDIRLDKKNKPYVLDINQIPGLIPNPKENSRYPLAARKAGYTFEQMLNKIIKEALKRYKTKTTCH